MSEKIAISGFDYNEMQENLIRFLRTHDEWSDYNFEAGGMATIIKLLAYHATYEAIQQNVVFNELHLNTAQLYENVCADVSLLSYVPGSKTAGNILTDIIVTPSNTSIAPSSLTLSRYVKFLGIIDNKTFIFVPDQDYIASLENGQYIFESVNLIQGIRTINTFKYVGTGINNFQIPNTNIDIDTLSVSVQQSEFNTDTSTYTRFISPHQLGASERIFFIEKNRFGYYSIEFGDDQIATKPTDGNIIIAEYIVTDGDEANGINSISLTETISGYSDVSISLLADYVSGGTDIETTESIKFNAPKTFANQGSVVTSNDYINITRNLYTNIDDITAWGGEDNIPKKVGYVMISIKPNDAETLTDDQKDEVIGLLDQYHIGSITPIIVDPKYYYLNIDSNIMYDPTLTSMEQNLLKIKIKNYIETYSETKLGTFSTRFIHSKLVEYINNIDKCIIGNNTDINLEKRVVPDLNENNIIIIEFNNELKTGSVNITGFQMANTDVITPTFYMVDDSNGILTMRKIDSLGVDSLVYSNAGTVDYYSGTITITTFIPTEIEDDYVKITAELADCVEQDIFPTNHEIIIINTDETNISLEAIREE